MWRVGGDHPALTTFLRERIDGGVAEKEALRVGLSGGTDSSDAAVDPLAQKGGERRMTRRLFLHAS